MKNRVLHRATSGLSIIEVLVAIAISSLLAAGLLVSLNQTNKVTQTIDRLVSTDDRVALLRYQLERDIVGAFIPTQAVQVKKEESKAPEKTNPVQSMEAGKQPEQAQKKDEKEVPPLEKVFYATQKGEQLELLTFITNNPLQAYDKPRPYVTRVVYRLRESKNTKGALTLIRQESTNLVFEAFNEEGEKGVRGYELIDGIKTISMKFFIKEEPKQEEKKPEQQKPGQQEKKSNEQQPVTYKLINDWDIKKMQEESQEKKTKLMQQLPKFIQVTAVLLEGDTRRERTETFTIALFADIANCPVPLSNQQKIAPAPAKPDASQPEKPDTIAKAPISSTTTSPATQMLPTAAGRAPTTLPAQLPQTTVRAGARR